jgi:hypothetical protein
VDGAKLLYLIVSQLLGWLVLLHGAQRPRTKSCWCCGTRFAVLRPMIIQTIMFSSVQPSSVQQALAGQQRTGHEHQAGVA